MLTKTISTRIPWCAAVLLLAYSNAIQAQTQIFPFGSTWKYLDNGTNQGTGWRAASFSDASWKSGPGQLGYGDGDEATTVSYGGNASNKYITTYFRRSFAVIGKGNYSSFKLEYKRDDGIVIYINGTEVKRNDMPSGTVSYTTTASAAVSDDGATVQSITIATNNFIEGNNVIAVEIHQSSITSSDISFDLRLTGNATTPPPVVADTVTRGPYLQMVNQNAITIRWATNNATDSKVRWGTAQGNLTGSMTDAAKTTEHELRISGLTADTKYFYSVGTTTTDLQESGQNFFNTAPPSTTTRKIRIAAYGDCGNNSTNQVNVKNAYLNYMGSNATDVWLLLGDNAYDQGLTTEFQSKFFNIYKNDLLKNAPLFPALGNHEYGNNATRQDDHNIAYLSLFSLPKNGECGGLASGKEEYYSFDYGDIHFISLDSYGEELNKRFYDTTSAQAIWLKNDLSANQRKWTIVYFHHPPYSMGGKNSDTDPELVAVRTKLLRIFERFGVDLVLAGHSHTYERSYLLHDHFGLENTFSFTANTMSNSSGAYNGSASSCPYTSTAAKTKHGTVYVVAGSAGQIGGTQASFPHAAMYYSNATTGGSLEIEIQDNRLDAKFIAADKTIKDQFSIFKDVNKATTVTVSSGQPATLTASWIGNYNWNTGAITKAITINQPDGNYEYIATDNANSLSKCLSDTFHVQVGSGIVNGRMANATTEITRDFSFKIYPNPASGRPALITIYSNYRQRIKYIVQDISGRVVYDRNAEVFPGQTQLSLGLPSGTYIVKLSNLKGARHTEKLIVQ